MSRTNSFITICAFCSATVVVRHSGRQNQWPAAEYAAGNAASPYRMESSAPGTRSLQASAPVLSYYEEAAVPDQAGSRTGQSYRARAACPVLRVLAASLGLSKSCVSRSHYSP